MSRELEKLSLESTWATEKTSMADRPLTDLEFIYPAKSIKWHLGILRLLEEMFMPLDWRNTVLPDYVPYQIYDSLQAIFSSIAQLLATRESLVSLGVARADATVEAALLLNILSEGSSRVCAILFAWTASATLNAECKHYRFVADILNDIALVLSTASSAISSMPLRFSVMVLAAIFRARCGVCAGSSRAALTNHFARQESAVPDINAKDGSQETIIYLIGLLLGTAIVQFVTSIGDVWTWLLALIVLHLWANYKAVKSVAMTTLNRQRLNIVMSHYIQLEGEVLTPYEVAAREAILFPRKLMFPLRWTFPRDVAMLDMATTVSSKVDDKVAIIVPSADTLLVAVKGEATHLEIVEAIFLYAIQGLDKHRNWSAFQDALGNAGWDLRSDSLCYQGLRYRTQKKQA